MTSLSAKLQAVLARVAGAARQHGRDPGDVRLIAVSKTWSAEHVRQLAQVGQVAFGESYVTEALAKIGELRTLALDWHFVGSVQTNKTRLLAENFNWVHSVDRLRIGERLSAQRPAGLPPLSVCLQVNLSGEASKGGVSPAEAPGLAHALAALPNLRLRGLMTIPARSDSWPEQCRPFRQLRELYVRLQADGLMLDTLSMGMSHDLEAAIAEGATLVRVGTAIFGERNSA